MMHSFLPNELCARTEFFRLWRHRQLIGLQLWGPIDDAASLAWRTAVYSECEVGGWPRFFAVDLRQVDPQNSLLGRFQTASTGKIFLSKIEWMYALTGGSPGPLVVIRTVLRVIGAHNLSLLTSEADFHRAIEAARQGQRLAV